MMLTATGGLATVMMLASTTILLAASASGSSCGASFQSVIAPSTAFILPSRAMHGSYATTTTTRGGRGTGTALCAIGVLAKKAKEAELRRYVEAGVPDDVMEKYNLMKKSANDTPSPPSTKLQDAITRRRGTISVIAEYKRKLGESGGYVDEVFAPSILGATFREFGAQAASVMVDERVGGCTYADVTELVEEQRTAMGDVPGPLPVVAHDVLVDELQIAMAAAAGADAVVMSAGVVGEDGLGDLIDAGARIGVEAVVTVSNREEAEMAVKSGARILCVVAGAATDPKERADMLEGLESACDPPLPDEAICRVCAVPARDGKDLEEVQEAWVLRDLGFQAVLAGDCLYKAGNDPNEHAGAIIRSMIAKSSVQWASPTARSGKGEGSREYLGDIMM